MNERHITSSGRLADELFPAVYFDSSVVIDYWIAEGMEISKNKDDTEVTDVLWGPVAKIIRNLLKTETRINKVLEIREKLIYEDSKITAVTSELALWELQEWNAEANFKQAGAEISGYIYLQRKGKKEIGNYLKNIYELWKEEGDIGHHDPETGTSGLEILMQSSWVNLGFAHSHGLRGILLTPIKQFYWPPKQSRQSNPFSDPFMLAFLQLGVADIMHILIANHFGCEYIASFDSDFKRAKNIIEDTGMKILSSPEDILSIM
jgi:hypothetical protein